MKSISWTILVFFAHTSNAKTHMQIGNYGGVDKYGRECSVFLGTNFGGQYMDFYWYRNADGSYRAGTLSDAQPTSPGKIEGGQPLMAAGNEGNLPYFRSFYGTPIYTYVIDSKYTMNIEENILKSFDFYTAEFNGSYGENTGCRKLKYTGPKRE